MNINGSGLKLLRRTLAGYASHPNLAGVLVVGLGCEVNQIPEWLKQLANSIGNGPLVGRKFERFEKNSRIDIYHHVPRITNTLKRGLDE